VRRRDIRVDDETLFEFYDARIGPEVVSGRHFDTWWKQARRESPELLDFEQSLLVRNSFEVPEEDFPTSGAAATSSCRSRTCSNPVRRSTASPLTCRWPS
jgi:HrpA-like RNA helicase